ncbi:MAG: hypothetical protein Ct9H90mP16_08920 [Candidatus Poseidoniales archaeon]|nr:MAG: hypothetical protein Ct9H90mP16_08920 [Candidatus Poseidoniales archaeon]
MQTFFEGRSGSGTVAWMMHGMLWTSIGAHSPSSVCGWLTNPGAIASLSSIYYDPSAATVQNAAYGAASGGILMLLIGAGLHINGRLSGAGLASDTNAVLVSYAFSMSLFLGFVSDHTDSSWGDLLCSAAGVISVLVMLPNSCKSPAALGSKNQRHRDAQPVADHRWSSPSTHHVCCRLRSRLA